MSIQTDLKNFLRERGVTQEQFARIAGVNPCSLSLFLRRQGLSIAERITPYLYGDKRDLVQPKGAEQPRAQG